MNISFPRILSFKGHIKPDWQTSKTNNDVVIFDPITLPNDTFGPLTLDIKGNPSGKNDFTISIKNSLKKLIGQETMRILPEYKMIAGQLMEVEPEYRKSGKRRGHKFGELLRLSSVMALMQNKLNYIYINSKDSAVYFHSKYKFEPYIYDAMERDRALETIIQDKSENFEDLRQRAEKIYLKVKRPYNTENINKGYMKATNNLVKEYIQRAMQEPNPNENHHFKKGLDMILTKENVKRNKDYFNELFKKHGIDYQI